MSALHPCRAKSPEWLKCTLIEREPHNPCGALTKRDRSGPVQFDTRRRWHRRPFSYPVFIDIGHQDIEPIPCRFSDISSTGARVYLPANDDLPELVTLLLTEKGVGRRPCKIVWRSSTEIGLLFLQNGKRAGWFTDAAPILAPTSTGKIVRYQLQ